MDSLSRDVTSYIFENRTIIRKFFDAPSTDGEILLPANKYRSTLITKGGERMLELNKGCIMILVSRKGFEEFILESLIDKQLLNPDDGQTQKE